MVLCCALATVAQAQVPPTPIYKLGEIMADGQACHEGIMVQLTRRPDTYGCDLDRDRMIGRALRLNDDERVEREREYDELKRKAQELDKLKAQ
jgi:hypothetical protein